MAPTACRKQAKIIVSKFQFSVLFSCCSPFLSILFKPFDSCFVFDLSCIRVSRMPCNYLSFRHTSYTLNCAALLDVSNIFYRLALITSATVCFSSAVLSTSSLVFLSIWLVFSILLQHHISKSSCFFSVLCTTRVSHLYDPTLLHAFRVLTNLFLTFRCILNIFKIFVLLKSVFANVMCWFIFWALLPSNVILLYVPNLVFIYILIYINGFLTQMS